MINPLGYLLDTHGHENQSSSLNNLGREARNIDARPQPHDRASEAHKLRNSALVCPELNSTALRLLCITLLELSGSTNRFLLMARYALRSVSCVSGIGISQNRKLSLAYTHHEAKVVGRKGSSNSAIVILHGLFGSKQNNRSISKALARCLNCSVYALDLRNHGDSPHHTEHTYSTMADDVEQFVNENIDGPVTLIGHSM